MCDKNYADDENTFTDVWKEMTFVHIAPKLNIDDNAFQIEESFDVLSENETN